MSLGAQGEAFFLGMYPGQELPGHSIYVGSSLVENAKPFSKGIEPAVYESLVVNVINVGVEWYHIFILTCIFLMTYDVKDFFVLTGIGIYSFVRWLFCSTFKLGCQYFSIDL